MCRTLIICTDRAYKKAKETSIIGSGAFYIFINKANILLLLFFFEKKRMQKKLWLLVLFEYFITCIYGR